MAGHTQRHSIVRHFLRTFQDLSDSTAALYQCSAELDRLTSAELEDTLVEVLDDPCDDTRLMAAVILVQLGDPDHDGAAREFIAGLTSDDPMRCLVTALVVGPIRVPSAARPPLVRLLRCGTWALRVAAAAALIDPPSSTGNKLSLGGGGEEFLFSPTEVLGVLNQALRDASPALAAKRAVELNPDLEAVKPEELDRVAASLDDSIKTVAADALRRSAVGPSTLMDTLIKTLEGGAPDAKLQAVYSLLTMGKAAGRAIPSLIRLLLDRDTGRDLKLAIASTLGRIGKGSTERRQLVKPLISVTRSADWLLTCKAAESLQALGEAPQPVMRALVEAAGHADPAARHLAALALIPFADHLESHLPALIDRLRREDDKEAALALEHVLAAIGPPAVAPLIDLVREGDLRSTTWAAGALLAMGETVATRLAELLRSDPSEFVRSCALLALIQMGPRAVPAVPLLAEMLGADMPDDDEIPPQVIKILGSVGPAARGALPALIRALLGHDTDSRYWAEHALIAIGNNSVPALEQALAESDADGRTRISQVLGRLGWAGGRGAGDDDFSWVNNDNLLELFAHIGLLLREQGPLSYRRLASEMARKREQKIASPKLPVTDPSIREWLDSLETLLSKKEKRSIRLKNRESTRTGGLSEFGEQLLPKVLSYLDSIGRPVRP